MTEQKKDDVVISLYAAQEKIYPRSTFGFFTKWRWVMIWLTQAFFYCVPWIQSSGRQALLFDLEAKRFFIFNLVLYPQDLIYLTAILIISALSLFLFTAVAGRLWCGYTCPQTVYTEIFLWIENKIEGDRAKRMKLDAANMSQTKFLKKGAKHFVWIAFALWTGFTFVGYFTPIRELWAALLTFSLGPWETFWVLFYGFATYGNAGFMREQVCKYMCPYARFQSAMFDDDTLIVTYDEGRGEPRNRGSKKSMPSAAKGDCIDCTLCVQVCPTGIDIRKGLQYECIGCGACVDVCDTVMDKIKAPRGLIKYSTENAIQNSWTKNTMIKRIFRPRVLIYSAILWLLIGGLATSVALRDSFRVDVVRDRGVMARIVDGGLLENVYRLQLMNHTEHTQYYRVTATGIDELTIDSDGFNKDSTVPNALALSAKEYATTVTVESTKARWISVRLDMPFGALPSGTHPVKFHIESINTQETVDEKSMFLVPRS